MFSSCSLGRGGIGPKAVALIGVLGAAMVALRLPGFVAGFSAMFIVVLVAGNAFGPGFGFLLGALGTFASGLFLGGLGPWLPFQMVAVGWVGMGAGIVAADQSTSWRVRSARLAAYGVVSRIPVRRHHQPLGLALRRGQQQPRLGPRGGRARQSRSLPSYYAVTSLGWDTFRAVGNAALVILLGRPLLGALDRAARRMNLVVRSVDNG